MLFDVPSITNALNTVFTKQQPAVLARVIHDAHTDLVKTLVTHYAHPAVLAEADRRKIMSAQSFEW